MFLEKIAPKKFLCKFTLRLGAQVTAILEVCLYVVLSILTVILAVDFEHCAGCPETTGRTAHALCVNYAAFTCAMILVSVWFLWGVTKQKSTVIIGWVVVKAVWLIDALVLIIIMACLSSSQSKLVGWQTSLAFTLITWCIQVYFWFIGYGYFLEIRNDR